MVQIDIPAAFIVSQLLLDIRRDKVKKEAGESRGTRPAIYYQLLARTLLFAGAVIAPAGIYLLSGWPGWEQIYWHAAPEHTLYHWKNALYPASFVAAIVLAGYLGHALGYRWLTTGKESVLRPAYLGLLAAVSILVICNYPAFLLVGSYDEYHSNRQVMGNVWSNPHDFSIGWLLVMAYFFVAFTVLVVKTRRDATTTTTEV
jgi:hypothetical protein